jgi:hypothetical protein
MNELVYEMVWDCRYCGAKKLLGLTHRHCPNCGAQQDPNARYFPADHEKVAVQNHEFVGADVQCRYCGGASSKRAHNCGQCGAPLVEGAAVQPRPHVSPQPLAAAVAGAPRLAAWKVVVPLGAAPSTSIAWGRRANRPGAVSCRRRPRKCHVTVSVMARPRSPTARIATRRREIAVMAPSRKSKCAPRNSKTSPSTKTNATMWS